MQNIKYLLKLLLVWLVAVPTVQAAIAYRASSSATNRGFGYIGSSSSSATASSGNVTPALPSGTSSAYAKDDLLICLVESNDNVVPSISSPSGWTRLYSISNNSSSQASLFYKFAASSSETNPTISHANGNGIVAGCSAFAGIDTTTPFDTSYGAAASAADQTVETGSVTTVTANTMLIFAAHMADNHNSLSVTNARGLTWKNSFFWAGSSGNGAGQAISLSYALQPSAGSILSIVGTVTTNTSSSNPSTDARSNGVLIALRPKANSYPITINVPSGTVSGDVMLASIAVSPDTPTISIPAGWTVVKSIPNANPTASRLTIYSRIATASEPSNYTWAITPHLGAVGGITSFSGVDNTNPISVDSGQTTPASKTHATPSITTTLSNSMLVGIFSYASSGTWTAPSNMTEVVDVASRSTPGGSGEAMEMVYQLQATAGASSNKSAIASTSADAGATELIALQPIAAVVGPDHIQIEHDGSGVICAPENIVLKACADATCSKLYTGGATSVTLSAASNPTTSAISWSANPVTFTGSTSVNLSVTSATTITLGTSAVSPTPLKASSCLVNAALNCSLPFNSSGFVFSVIPNQIASQTSATMNLSVITGSSGGTCAGLSSGTKSVELAFQCDDPATCAGKQVMVNSTPIASNPASGISTYAATNLTFNASSNATFTVSYPDVGKINLAARYSLGGGNYMYGMSNMFVVKPYAFAFSNIKRTADNFANPAASNATGSMFIKAGNLFSTSVAAVDAASNVTPNFGKEAVAEGGLLGFNLVAPAGGDPGVLDGSMVINGSAFVNGVASVTDLSWDEVGVITLKASILDGNYLGAGDILSTSVNIGRFTPDHFATQVLPACTVNTPFTYSGQHADIAVTAYDANENLTQNYDNALGFVKTITLSNAGNASGFTFNTLNTGFVGGIGTDTDVIYTFPSPLTAPTTLTIRAVDTDGINSVSPLEDADLIYSGRLNAGNAAGSELLDLSVGLQTEYWLNGSFVLNTDDGCTLVTVPSVGSGLTFGGNLTASNTTLSINGLTSGSAPILAGLGNMLLSAAGLNHTGYVDISVAAPSWLKFNWKGAGIVNPSAKATFGLYKGNEQIIYVREVY